MELTIIDRPIVYLFDQVLIVSVAMRDAGYRLARSPFEVRNPTLFQVGQTSLKNVNRTSVLVMSSLYLGHDYGRLDREGAPGKLVYDNLDGPKTKLRQRDPPALIYVDHCSGVTKIARRFCCPN